MQFEIILGISKGHPFKWIYIFFLILMIIIIRFLRWISVMFITPSVDSTPAPGSGRYVIRP